MTIISKLLIAISAVLLTSCANVPDVRTDVDPTAHFSSYRTFAFIQPLATVRAGYTSLVTERFRQDISQQLIARGYALNEQSPDLLVNFHTVNKQKVDYLGPPVMNVPWGPDYYGFRSGYYSAWPGYVTAPDIMQYTVGVVSIDLVDARRRQLVWEGVSSGLVDSIQQENSMQEIQKVVAAIFAKYPYVAGDDRPRPPANK